MAFRERPAILYGCFGVVLALVGIFGMTHTGISVFTRETLVNSNMLPAFGCVALIGVQLLVLGYLVDQQRGFVVLRRQRVLQRRRRRAVRRLDP